MKILLIIIGVVLSLLGGFGYLMYKVGENESYMHRCGNSHHFRDY